MSTALARIAQNREPLTASARAKNAVAADDTTSTRTAPRRVSARWLQSGAARAPTSAVTANTSPMRCGVRPRPLSSSAKKGMNAEPADAGDQKEQAQRPQAAEVGPLPTACRRGPRRPRVRFVGAVRLSCELAHRLAW